MILWQCLKALSTGSRRRVGLWAVWTAETARNDVKHDVSRQPKERTGATDLRLVGVSGDETTIRFYLTSTP